jgi:flagellin
MERLSSGMRINRAGDDAAGLAISEKMRGQIRGLKQAARNAQDGISLIQTAEGALNETHAILQRMRELATQSATDTNTGVDRKEIQEEINQLAAEITRIADTTEFNTQNLLGGQFKAKFHIGANAGQNVELAVNAMDANALKVAGDGEGLAQFEVDGAVAINNNPGTGLVDGEQTLEVVDVDNVTVGTGVDEVVANYGLANDKGEIVAVSNDGLTYRFLTEATKASDLGKATPNAVADAQVVFSEKVIDGEVTLKATVANGQTTAVADVKATGSVDVKGLEAGEYKVAGFDAGTHLKDVTFASGVGETPAHPTFVLLNSDDEVVAVSDDGKAWYAVDDLDLTVDMANGWDTDVVADKEAILTVTNAFADGDKFEVKADGGIDVSTQAAADKAITIINDALETVSAERSKLGAMQNRLEHTIANLGTSAENLQAAESRIRDLDMAEEIMAFTKNNILQQAATAMLAQANMAPQSVLQLLG